MKALVTGGCGFIGSHLVKKLVDEGAFVTVVDDLSSGDIGNLVEKNVKCRVVQPGLWSHFLRQVPMMENDEVLVVTGDFVDRQVLEQLANDSFTHIFHLAANPRVEYSVINPAVSTEANLMKTIELLSACRHLNLEHFVFASSSAAYGNVDDGFGVATVETSSKDPTSPYGLQKLSCEMFMKLFSDLYGVPSTALRFFNAYGPGAADGSAYMTAITAWCHCLSTGAPLRFDGDGEQTRDMVYVGDLAEAMFRISGVDRKTFSAFNVGTGVSVSNNEIITKLRAFFPQLELSRAPERPGDVKHTLAAVDKISEEIGWVPQTDLDTGLYKTLQWWNLA